MIAILGLVFWGLQYWNQQITQSAYEQSSLLDELTLRAFQVALLSRDTALYPKEPRPQRQWQVAYEKLAELLNSISTENNQEWQEFRFSSHQLDLLHDRLVRNINMPDSDANDITRKRYERINSRIFSEAQSIVSNASLLRKKGMQEFSRQANELQTIGILLIVLIILPIFSIAVIIAQGIIKGLDALKQGTLEVTSGNLNYRAEVKSADELEDFAKAFNLMVEKLSLTMTSRDKLESIIKDRTSSLEKSRLAAISVMEDIDSQQKMLQKANLDLQNEILARKNTESELIKAKQNADYANKSKSIFLANMSHELRTPLNAILGFSELLRNSPNISGEQKENLNTIHRSGDHLLKLINDILDLTKIESGHINVEEKPLDLGNIVTETIDIMLQRAETKGLTLSFDQTSKFPRYIQSDAGKLRQVLLNFTSNAIKYTEQGEIKVRLDVVDEKLYIEVSDTGIGIKQNEIDQLFSPFVQVSGASDKTGTGLGLAITKQFIQLLNGEYGVSSEFGKGSTFWAKIPYRQADGKSLETYAEQSKVVDVIGFKGKPQHRKILIVEDHDDSRILLRSILKVLDIQIKEASDGQQAVEIFRHWKPDLIWMDRRMPILDGEQATKTIRNLPDGNGVKIIALTASAFNEERENIMALGMDDFITKPYRAHEIFQCMQEQLGYEYLYKEEQFEEKAGLPNISEQDIHKLLLRLDTETLDLLYDAAVILDMDSILPVIEQIKVSDTNLADKLMQLASHFQFNVILKLIDSIRVQK